MRSIRVLDTMHGNAHQQIRYTAVDAKAGWFTSRYPIEGRLEAEMCEGCGRVVLRAVPEAE
jgi:hypothetical protein